jgi:hypothetical protein
MFSHQNFEVTFKTLDLFNLGAGDEVDVTMPADLDQFWRDNSHGAIIGWKGLVEFRHHPPNGRGFFQEMNLVAGICQIQGRLHPGNATSHDKDGSHLSFSHELLLTQRHIYRYSNEAPY